MVDRLFKLHLQDKYMIEKISITTDVGVNNMSVGYDDLVTVKGLNLQSLSDSPVIQINNDKLELLKVEVECILDELFSKRKEADLTNKNNIVTNREAGNKGTIDNKYYEQAMRLNLRNSADFHIGIFVSLWEFIVLAISFKGSLYIFDRGLLAKHLGASIIAFLRNNKVRGRENLKNGLIKLFEQYNIDLEVDDATLNMGLENLQKYGLISYSQEDDEYLLTARGIMYR